MRIHNRAGLVVVAMSCLCLLAPAVASAQKAIFLVRHGEKVDDSKDAALSDAGRARARTLAAMLADAGVTAVYATQYQRTQNTARPLAEAKKLAITLVDDTDSATLVKQLATKHANDVVLVAAHSHTIPEIIKLLGYRTPITIAAPEYDSLFVIVPQPQGEPLLMRLRY